jgi:hypothetical protein
VEIVFPLCFPLLTVFRVQLLIEFLHPAGTFLAHFLGHVVEIGLYGLDIVSCVQGGIG